MILCMFSVYDTKAQAFIPPFFLPNVAMAERAFADSANDATHAFCRNPLDYVLYSLGNFSDDLGSFDLFLVPTILGSALRFQTAAGIVE